MIPVHDRDSPIASSGPRPRPGVVRLMLTRRIVRSAAKVALFVGTVLNAINYGQQLWVEHGASLWHLAFNDVVPHLVSSYSAARSQWATAGSVDVPKAVHRQ